MSETWNATGLLRPLWSRYGEPPYQRERLAAKVGTSPSVLSAINTGRRDLGLPLAERLAAELGVSLHDLGRPAVAGVPQWEPLVLDRLQALEDALAVASENSARLTRRVTALQARVRRLESQRVHVLGDAAEEL